VDGRLVVVALILFVNALGSGLILPLLPFFATEMAASPFAVGLLIATLPLCATLVGPPLGVLADRHGRRPVLLFSVAGTLIGFVLLGVAQTLPVVFLARAVDGASAGNTSTARAAIADITPRKARAGGLGVTFAMESLGLILGPVLGAVFSPYGLRVSAFVAAGIALVCLLLVLVAFPETRPDDPAPATGRGGLRLDELLAALRSGRTRAMVLLAFAVQLLVMMMWGTLALHANALFGFAGREMGYVSAFAAAVGIASQVALLRLLTRRVAERPILAGALVAMGAGQLLLAAADAPPVLLAGVALMAGAFNVAMPTAMGLASRLAAEHEQGALMGTLSSAVSAASVAGPVAGGLLFGFSPRGSYAVAAAVALAASVATGWASCARRAPTTSYGS